MKGNEMVKWIVFNMPVQEISVLNFCAFSSLFNLLGREDSKKCNTFICDNFVDDYMLGVAIALHV